MTPPPRLSRVERSSEGIPLVVGDGKYPHDPPRPASDLEVRLWDALTGIASARYSSSLTAINEAFDAADRALGRV